MKRYLATVLSLVMGLSLSAQNMYDAYTFGNTDYLGSARVLGLGGAVTAIGSDLGTIGINPAGSAVAQYSQFVLSAGLSTAKTSTMYQLDPNARLESPYKYKRSTLTLPNIGFSTRLDFGGMSATFAIVVNTVDDFHYAHMGQGLNSRSSKFAEMARAVNGIPEAELAANNFYDRSEFSHLWDAAMGYDAGLFNACGDGKYVGCTEVLTDSGMRYVPSDLLQRSNIINTGSKEDIILNMALDISNNFFIGVNLGIPVFSYSNVERYSEIAQVVEDFPVQFTHSNGSVQNTYFDNAIYQYNYNASGSGVYGKLGIIWLPVKGLRIGAAYQTPSYMSVTETWMHSGRVLYADGTNYSAKSKEGMYYYDMVTPSHIDLGVAYTFSTSGLVSLDYTLEDYSSVKFKDAYKDGNGFNDPYAVENAAINAFSGYSHCVRVGVEYNLLPALAVRAGFNIKTSAEKYYQDLGQDIYYSDYNENYYQGRYHLPQDFKYVPDVRKSFSFGFSINPASSFYADFAMRFASYPTKVYRPYMDYPEAYSPIYTSNYNAVHAVLTCGWRF